MDLTDPNGRVSPLSLLLGQAVHDAIGSDWEQGKESTTLSGRVYDESIRNLTNSGGYSRKSNWLMKLYFGVSSLARPDLAATVQHAIYEIKSSDEKVQGEIKLGYYLDLLHELDPDSNWRLGGDLEYTPRESLLFKNNITRYDITVLPPQEGLILYIWNPYQDALNAVASGIAAVGVLGEEAGSLSGVGGL